MDTISISTIIAEFTLLIFNFFDDALEQCSTLQIFVKTLDMFFLVCQSQFPAQDTYPTGAVDYERFIC